MRLARGIIALSFCVLMLGAVSVRAEAFGVGFPEFDAGQSLLDSRELMPMFVRLAITAPLIGDSSPAHGSTDSRQYALVSDAYNVSSDYGRWSFRLKNTARFSDRSLVRVEDVVFSLQRCSRGGTLPELVSLAGHADRGVTWVEMVVRPRGADEVKRLISGLARCPIVQRKSSISFGADLGLGSNIVSGGGYVISAVVPGRKYILTRVRQSSIDRAGLEQFELRAFREWDQGLAALRVGTIRALAWRDANLDQRARADETLEVERCSDYWLIRRRGVTMNCIERLSVLEILSNE